MGPMMPTSTRTRRSGAVIGSLLAAALLAAGASPVAAQAAQEEPDYPHAYPREGVTKRFENDRVIVWEVLWLDGVPQPYHRHRYDMTGVFLRWGPLRVTRPDGTFTVSETPFEIPSTFLLPKDVTHKEEGIGQPERHSIMIDLKDDPPPAPAARTDLPTAVPMDGATLMLDHARVKVWDVPLSEGQDLPLHVHHTDTAVVFLEGGSLRSIAEDGAEEDRTYAYKDVDYWPAGHAHRLVVVDGAPRAILFELQD